MTDPGPVTSLGRLSDATLELSRGAELLRGDPNRFLKLPGEPFYEVLFELQDVLLWSTVEFWRATGAKYLFLPLTTNAASSPMGLGSDSSPVQVRLSGVDTYLADSMQFFLEYGCRLWQHGAYYVMPSFRGDAVDATHLSQFTHSEVELPRTFEEILDVAEDYIVYVCQQILTTIAAATRLPSIDLSHVEALVAAERGAFRRVSFDDAVAAIGNDGDLVREVAPGARTLTRKGERAVINTFGEFTWVTHWDHLSVPFYQAFSHPDRGKARNGDLLFGPGEVVGAGERHATGDAVRAALAMHEVNLEEYEWYVRLKDELPQTTSGFGLGIERFLMWVLRHSDIRDLQLLMRESGVPHVP